jgi:hypothetical protein
MYTVKENEFVFDAKDLELDNPFKELSWAPSGADHSPGIRVRFHGSPSPLHRKGCPAATESGRANCKDEGCFVKVTDQPGPLGGDIKVTGQVLPYIKYLPTCPDSQSDAIGPMGPAFCSASKDSIALYSCTGKRSYDRNLPFFQTIQVYGSNPNLQAVYCSFATSEGHMKPFSGPDKTLIVRSNQQVASSLVPEGCRAIQKMAFVLYNVKDKSRKGRIEYSPNTYTQGVNADIPTAKIFFDPNQGGHPFIGGNLLSEGAQTKIRAKPGVFKTHTCWSSNVATSHNPHDMVKYYKMYIKWSWFIQTLRHITFKAGLDGQSYEDMASVFGPGWNRRENWELKNARFGQEILNKELDDTLVYLGGRCQLFSAEAV